MIEDILLGLAGIIILGIGATWLAWRLHLPSILLLLLAGFIIGPVTDLLEPSEIFGDLLMPIVSLSVAIILFEGGLNLSIEQLRKTGSVVRNLITIGVTVTWAITTAAAYLLFDLDFKLALLLGAVLVVTGPTVIIPLLRHLRPSGKVGTILKWEGIVIDPIGAILAVLVFEATLASGPQEAAGLVVSDLLITVILGGTIGFLGARLLVQLFKNYQVPDFLHNTVTLAIAIAVFTLSNLAQTDSGLLAVTVMGIALANQKTVSVKHIVEFKENLRVLLIAALFILLAANLNMDSLSALSIGSSIAFLVVLLFVARPLSVFLSTIKSGLGARERAFLAGIAPRGIVAAAVSSVFALRLAEAGYPQAELLVPITFMVIAVTVAVYGLTASPLARRLKIAEPNPQGFIIVGGHSLGRQLGDVLIKEGYSVQLVDSNWANVSAARMAGIPTLYANVLSEYALDELELGGKGRLLALTTDNEFNTLVVTQFVNIFGRAEVYQLSAGSQKEEGKGAVAKHLRGRIISGSEVTYARLASRIARGALVKTTSLTEEFGYQAFNEKYGEEAIPLFLINSDGRLTVFTPDSQLEPKPGQKLVSLIG
jgi:NhaP-type Na+/H+ or K+/H+ antiporter